MRSVLIAGFSAALSPTSPPLNSSNQVYMVILAVVLLNLLIAVLSTAHSKVYDNGDKEFHLARAKLIYQSARVVTRRRPPPPLNLVKAVLGTLIDAATEPVRFSRWLARCDHLQRKLSVFGLTP